MEFPEPGGFVRDVHPEAWTQQGLGEMVQVQAAGAGQRRGSSIDWAH